MLEHPDERRGDSLTRGEPFICSVCPKLEPILGDVCGRLLPPVDAGRAVLWCLKILDSVLPSLEHTKYCFVALLDRMRHLGTVRT